MKRSILIFSLTLLILSCGSKKRAVSQSNKNKTRTERVVKRTQEPNSQIGNEPIQTNNSTKLTGTPTEQYIQLYGPIAQNEMRLYGIPASITLAQGILESGSGQGRLSKEANNHFGIKCHEWTGAKIYHDDDAHQECFRKYNDPRYSFRDHSLFLKERKRYYKLFELKPDDYKGWARELRAAGYATDRKYPDKLISLIERYELYKFDQAILGYESPTVDSVKMALTHQIIKGDTLYSLSKRYNTTVDELKRLNNLKSNDLTIGNVLVVKSQ
ncbi:N-acetylmuramidase [Hanstruepera neustonica]|uniref:Peptidoglycan hydrolase n=1 Tax=Hanstruepera neustonica TaxID=1445657 RepID=A0A2K1E0K2_9FLAO|nr:glucosaminidase domain-containing protein [Hanstruepera neustonica]PNQ73817.1 N-acetylmuramidase [Hanstruepera neustonica]